MKLLLTILFAALASLALCMPAKAQKSVIIVVTQGMTDTNQKAVVAASKSVLVGCDAGDDVQFYDGTTLQRVAVARVVKSPSSRARLVAHRAELGALETHLSSAPIPTEGGREPTANIPGLLTGLRIQGKPTRILIFASLYFNAETAATFSRGQYLSDGWILGTSRESVFGTSDLKGLLSGASIDWVCTDGAIETLEHRALTRYWCCWASELGAILTSVENTASVAVENTLKGLTTSVTNQTIDRSDTAMEVRVVRRTPPVVVATPTAPPPPAHLAAAAAAIPAPQRGFITISAVWDGAADCDLWVMPAAGRTELYFNAPRSEDGHLLRDIQRASDRNESDWTASWETVELREAAIGEATCYVNLYSNAGQRVDGLVRVRFEGRTVDIPFSFAAGKGDKAKGQAQRDRNDCWVKIDLARALASTASDARR